MPPIDDQVRWHRRAIYTATSSSWLKAIEGFFAKLTRRRLKHGVFRSITDLQAAINRFIAEHNESPRPFMWRAEPDEIIAARARGFQALESIYKDVRLRGGVADDSSRPRLPSMSSPAIRLG